MSRPKYFSPLFSHCRIISLRYVESAIKNFNWFSFERCGVRKYFRILNREDISSILYFKAPHEYLIRVVLWHLTSHCSNCRLCWWWWLSWLYLLFAGRHRTYISCSRRIIRKFQPTLTFRRSTWEFIGWRWVIRCIIQLFTAGWTPGEWSEWNMCTTWITSLSTPQKSVWEGLNIPNSTAITNTSTICRRTSEQKKLSSQQEKRENPWISFPSLFSKLVCWHFYAPSFYSVSWFLWWMRSWFSSESKGKKVTVNLDGKQRCCDKFSPLRWMLISNIF